MTLDLSQQLTAGKKAAENVKLTGKFERVIFCGVGGSAIPADIITMLWLKGLNAYVHRGYGLPYFADQHCLVICTSWSGETEEVLSSFRVAQAAHLPTAVVTRGGQLLALAQSASVPTVLLPADDVPARFGIGYMLAALLTLLSGSAIIDYSLEGYIGSRPMASPTFASRISGKIPLIYSSFPWRYLARMWKVNFNENSKLHAFFNYFPEAAHNEIAGFQPTQKDAYFPIILTDRAGEPTDVAKLTKFIGFLSAQGFDHSVVELAGATRLAKILNSYNQAVVVSTALAELQGIDPLDISVIEKFKKI